MGLLAKKRQTSNDTIQYQGTSNAAIIFETKKNIGAIFWANIPPNHLRARLLLQNKFKPTLATIFQLAITF